ncbi:MAG: bifunctional methylenetetrahydrofolate dehydrogenase/methenyltetrahydrofolate cyclohydrolase, partial [Actinomycetota bacterium]|nr:bifunctional methylenetetrahydrofolate dehydrogenase/methenyltetrahydrofolate cyclohydrolase [Actinomycetota bacterium]
MGAAILDGAAVAAQIKAELAERVRDLAEVGVQPGLGTILVGDNTASAAYVRLKHQDCAEVGIASFGEHLPADTAEDQLHEVIARYNADPAVDGFLVQTPLPAQLDEAAALMAVNP